MNDIYFRFIILLTLSFLFQVCVGQQGLQLSLDRHIPASQWFQPANIAKQDYQSLQIHAFGDLWLSNNQFTIGSLIKGGNFISETTKNDIIGQLKDDNHYQQGYSLGGSININVGNRPLLISFSYQDPFYIQTDDSITAGLIFRGNAPYAGQEITDQDVAIRSITYATIGVGTAWEMGKWTFGVHPKFIWGRRANIIEDLQYTLFTSENGGLISLQADYDAFGTLSGDRGWGVELDAGLLYEPKEGWILEAAIRNVGWIQWEGSQSNNSVDVNYEGIIWDNFLQGGGTNNLSLGDTLQTLFFPDSVRANYTLPSPGVVMLGSSIKLNAQDMIFASIHMGLTRIPPTTYLPLINIGYQRSVGEHLTLGINAYGGGMDMYGLGIYGKLAFGRNTRWGIFYTMDNALGLIAPEISQGLSLAGGIFVSR